MTAVTWLTLLLFTLSVADVPLPCLPTCMAPSYSTGLLYIGCGSQILIDDPTTPSLDAAFTDSSLSQLVDLAVSSDGQFIFALATSPSAILTLNASGTSLSVASIFDELPVGTQSIHLAASDSYLYLGNINPPNVVVLSVSSDGALSISSTETVGSFSGVKLHVSKEFVFLSTRGPSTVTVWSRNSKTGALTHFQNLEDIGPGPHVLACASDNRRLWAAVVQPAPYPGLLGFDRPTLFRLWKNITFDAERTLVDLALSPSDSVIGVVDANLGSVILLRLLGSSMNTASPEYVNSENFRDAVRLTFLSDTQFAVVSSGFTPMLAFGTVGSAIMATTSTSGQAVTSGSSGTTSTVSNVMTRIHLEECLKKQSVVDKMLLDIAKYVGCKVDRLILLTSPLCAMTPIKVFDMYAQNDEGELDLGRTVSISIAVNSGKLKEYGAIFSEVLPLSTSSSSIGTVTSGTSSSGHDVLPIAISFGVLGGLLLLAAIVGLAILYYRKKKEALMLVIMSAPEKTFYNQDYVGTPKEVGADPKPSPA